MVLDDLANGIDFFNGKRRVVCSLLNEVNGYDNLNNNDKHLNKQDRCWKGDFLTGKEKVRNYPENRAVVQAKMVITTYYFIGLNSIEAIFGSNYTCTWLILCHCNIIYFNEGQTYSC